MEFLSLSALITLNVKSPLFERTIRLCPLWIMFQAIVCIHCLLGCPLFWYFKNFHLWTFWMVLFHEKMIRTKFWTFKMKFRDGAKSFKFECGFLCRSAITMYSRVLLLHCDLNAFNNSQIQSFIKMKFRDGAKSFKFECGFLCRSAITMYSRVLLLHCDLNAFNNSQIQSFIILAVIRRSV